jgi:rfaE bifunctional protein kinase chain/domain
MTASEILEAIRHRSALVVGDICLDRWCTYDPALAEPSRETGIPRLAVVTTEVTPGAGGTVANNLAALGAGRVAVLGAVGEDGHGFELARALAGRGIESEMLIPSPGIQTFTYTKLINAASGVEDIPRVDFINRQALPGAVEEKVLERLRACASEFDVVFAADQAEAEQGVVTGRVRECLNEFAARRGDRVVWVDSRLRCALFRRAVIKPNEREAEAACRALFGQVDYERLRRHVESDLVMVTRGAGGVVVVEPGRQTLAPTRPNPNPVDICGAGDSFSAGAGMALAVTRNPILAAWFGNLVASVTITKRGTGVAAPEEVLAAAAAMPPPPNC